MKLSNNDNISSAGMFVAAAKIVTVNSVARDSAVCSEEKNETVLETHVLERI